MLAPLDPPVAPSELLPPTALAPEAATAPQPLVQSAPPEAAPVQPVAVPIGEPPASAEAPVITAPTAQPVAQSIPSTGQMMGVPPPPAYSEPVVSMPQPMAQSMPQPMTQPMPQPMTQMMSQPMPQPMVQQIPQPMAGAYNPYAPMMVPQMAPMMMPQQQPAMMVPCSMAQPYMQVPQPLYQPQPAPLPQPETKKSAAAPKVMKKTPWYKKPFQRSGKYSVSLNESKRGVAGTAAANAMQMQPLQQAGATAVPTTNVIVNCGGGGEAATKCPHCQRGHLTRERNHWLMALVIFCSLLVFPLSLLLLLTLKFTFHERCNFCRRRFGKYGKQTLGGDE